MQRRRLTPALAAALALAALVIAVYLPAAGFPFLSYDDPRTLTENPVVQRGLSIAGVRWAATTLHTGNWMPLTWLSHLAVVQAFGTAPGAHHLVNVALHLANTLLLFALLRGLTGATGKSAFVAAVFAAHPLHVESVAWVTERKDVLMTFFGLLALHAWVRAARRASPGWHAAATALFACGLLAKAMLVVLPALMVLLDAWPLGRWRTRGGAARSLLEKAPAFLLAAGAGSVAFLAQRAWGNLAPDVALSFPQKLAHAAVSLLWYVRASVWPSGLAVFYPYPPGAAPAGRVALALALLAAVCAAAFLLRRRAPAVGAGWLWFAGAVFPVLGLVQVGEQAVADRYMYLPLAGLAIAAAWGASAAAGRFPGARPLLAPAAIAAVGALAVAGMVQVRLWKSDEALFTHALAVTGGNYVAHNVLGAALLRQGRADDAAAHFREVVRLLPARVVGWNNLGQALFRAGRVEESVAVLREAVARFPGEPMLRRNLGDSLMTLGRREEAMEQYRLSGGRL
jgi:tetratricopeptide (TPR) repeat protein